MSSFSDGGDKPTRTSQDGSAAPAPSAPAAAHSVDDAPIPRLPRTTHFKVSPAAIFRIAMTAALLAMIVVAQRPCADAVSGFVTSFDNTAAGSGSAAMQMPKPGAVDVRVQAGSAGDYETLRPDMTEDEIKAAIERAKAKAKAARGSGANAEPLNGSAADGSAGGSAADGSAATGSAKGSANGSGAHGSAADGPAATGSAATGSANGSAAHGSAAMGAASGSGANGSGANGSGANGSGANGSGANGSGANGSAASIGAGAARRGSN